MTDTSQEQHDLEVHLGVVLGKLMIAKAALRDMETCSDEGQPQCLRCGHRATGPRSEPVAAHNPGCRLRVALDMLEAFND